MKIIGGLSNVSTHGVRSLESSSNYELQHLLLMDSKAELQFTSQNIVIHLVKPIFLDPLSSLLGEVRQDNISSSSLETCQSF